jgi:hypothetical protein
MSQEEMDKAIDNYLEISDLVKSDLNWVLDQEENSSQWNRTFIRTSIPLIEAYCNSLRDLIKVAKEHGFEICGKNLKAVEDENNCSADDRIKRNIRTAYKAFGLEPTPDFGCGEWEYMKAAIKKRGALMHPKTAHELDISKVEAEQYRDGISWICSQLFGFVELLVKK